MFQPEKINIVKTAIVKCHIDSPIDFVPEKAKGHDFSLDFGLSFNLEDKLVKADLKVELATKSEGKNEEEARGSFHFVYIFQVENLEELAVPDKNYRIGMNEGLGKALASIAYSTSRGILFTRLKGTSLENFVLPVIESDKLLNLSS